MKILFINSIQMFGGGEIWLFTAMTGLADRGHQVFLLCRPGKPLEKRAREKGYRVFTTPMRGDLDPISIYRTWHLCRELRVDAIITNMDKELRFGGLAARLAGVRAVIPRRGIDYPLKNKWSYRFAYNKLATAVIANSENTKRTLLRNCPWLIPERIKVIYNGVDTERFASPPKRDIRREFNIADASFVIGFVGQLDERKGVDTLLEGYQMLSASRENTTLLIVGEGPLEATMRKMAESVRGNVIFTGFRSDIDDIMKGIDLLTLPSLWEGFGIVLIEAMAAGKPVITTRTSNMPEIVDDGQEGFLIPVGDAAALADAIGLLYENPKLKKVMGKCGRERVHRQFTTSKMIDKTEKLLLKSAAR